MTQTANVVYIYLPPKPDATKQGVDDFFSSGGTLEGLLALAANEARELEGGGQSSLESPSQSATLVNYIDPNDLFHTPKRQAFVKLRIGSHVEVHSIDSEAVKLFLQRQHFEEAGRPPSDQALKEALSTLSAMAQFNGPECEVYVRVATVDGKTYLDLANPSWEVVEIDEDGWRILSESPVYFRRPGGMKALPTPGVQGDMNQLRKFVNIDSESSWYLLVTWMVQALYPTGPYPILILQGEQGSAKTTTAKLLKALLDPSVTAVRALPNNERDLTIGASNAWVLAFDNLSYINGATSDTLCRLSTGGGLAVRTLYTDSEETIFDVTRPVMLNGITDLTNRADLLDRAVVTHLPSIPPEKRRLESEFWAEFDKDAPGIFGSMLDTISEVQKQLPSVTLTSYPRMADFARYGAAVEKSQGWESGSFMEAYTENVEYLNDSTLEADPVATSVIEFMEDQDSWSGTATDLLAQLDVQVNDTVKRTKSWPKTPSALGSRLKRAAPVLRSQSIEYTKERTGGGGPRLTHLRKLNTGSQKSAPDVDAENAGLDCAEGDTSDRNFDTLGESQVVSSTEEIEMLTQALADEEDLAVDLETTGLDFHRDKVEIISISTGVKSWLIDCSGVDPSPLFPVLSEKHLIFHNAQFDLAFLAQLGFSIGEEGTISDTMLMSQVVEG